MNKRTIILIAICCLLAAATLTMRYITQEIAIIRAKFVGEKRTEERTSRNLGFPRPAPTPAPQTEKVPAAVKQNQNHPSGSAAGQFPPAVPSGSPVAASRTANTTTVREPVKRAPATDVLPDAGGTAPAEEVTTPLEHESPAAVYDDHPLSEREVAAVVTESSAGHAEEKKVPVAQAQRGTDAATAAALEHAADAESRGMMEEAAAGGKREASQGEGDAGDEDAAALAQDGEYAEDAGAPVAAEDEAPQDADGGGTEQEEEAADEE